MATNISTLIDCNNVIVNPVDVATWGDYILVLDDRNVIIFTPMGILIKKCPIEIPGQPVSLKTFKKMLIITRYGLCHLS